MLKAILIKVQKDGRSQKEKASTILENTNIMNRMCIINIVVHINILGKDVSVAVSEGNSKLLETGKIVILFIKWQKTWLNWVLLLSRKQNMEAMNLDT